MWTAPDEMLSTERSPSARLTPDPPFEPGQSNSPERLLAELPPSHDCSDSGGDLPEPPAKRTRVTVEDVEDEEDGQRFPMKYPGNVAAVLGEGETEFAKLHEAQEASGQSPWAPFKDRDEWELAEWLSKRVNKTGTEEFLKLPIVCLVSFSFLLTPLTVSQNDAL
jgi:hypothetical protein